MTLSHTPNQLPTHLTPLHLLAIVSEGQWGQERSCVWARYERQGRVYGELRLEMEGSAGRRGKGSRLRERMTYKRRSRHEGGAGRRNVEGRGCGRLDMWDYIERLWWTVCRKGERGLDSTKMTKKSGPLSHHHQLFVIQAGSDSYHWWLVIQIGSNGCFSLSVLTSDTCRRIKNG